MSENGTEFVDVVVVGAGISGIGAGYHLQTMCPDKTYTILEGRKDLGGTWDLFRYPGVRSDSDMHTLGFGFKPWEADKAIADGPAILAYLRETAEENGIDSKIRFQHLATTAEWNSDTAEWTITATKGPQQERVQIRCNFLFMCSGYYSYKGGYEPEFEGRDRFKGDVIHPQKWPDNYSHDDKRVVVIGSGATAMTLVPAMSKTASHVTMLQRTPTYVVARPEKDVLANLLRKVLPSQTAYAITRWKNIKLSQLIYKQSRTKPQKVKKNLLKMVRKELGDDYDVDTHFTPSYNPWDQRLCLVPNGDLFKSIKSGEASVVTDHIDTFTETGIKLKSGEHLDADVIVTATGLQLVTVGEMDFIVDGAHVDFAKTVTYKGLSYSGVPNLASSFGYINASWTLRADLISEYVCNLLNHMTETGTDIATPTMRKSDQDMELRPLVEDFSAGYMQRMMSMLPRQGDRSPWLSTQNYAADKRILQDAPIADGVLLFSRAKEPAISSPA